MMRALRIAFASGLAALVAVAAGGLPARAQPAAGDAAGSISVPAFAMPLSPFMSEAARNAFVDRQRNPPKIDFSSIERYRQTLDEAYLGPLLARQRALYKVEIASAVIGGVKADIVTPVAGESHRERVLINLHGGGFVVGGGGVGGQLESVPIAGLGRIKVVTVDYRQGPEFRFPAGSEDVAAVYRELLKTHRAENIGIYGCSAGGMLTAMSVAWFQKHGLPRPGAIGIFCAAATPLEGDSQTTAGRLMGERPRPGGAQPMGYFAGTDPKDPLVNPAASDAVMAAFPPTLLITGTRAMDMSGAVETHRVLSRVGVESDLLLWDGMWHAFFYDPDLPESQEVYAAAVRFFDRHLGRRPAAK